MMRLKRIAAAAACALSLACPASAQLIGSGHVLGNGTSSPASPTDTSLLQILNQSGSGLSRAGNGTSLATVSGTIANGHCRSTDSNGNDVDAGGPCTIGGGGGTVTSGNAGQLASYPSTGTTVSGINQSQLLSVRSVGADMTTVLFGQILAGTNTTPTGPGASGDLTTSIQTTINTVSAQGGGTVFFPAALGPYWVCDLTVPMNITLQGVPYGSHIEATANCPNGPILSASATQSGDAWVDIRRTLANITLAGGGSIVVSGTTTDVHSGDLMFTQDSTGAFVVYTAGTVSQNTPSAGLTTITMGTCLSSCNTSNNTFINQVNNGSPWRDNSNVQVSNVVLDGVYIDGNALNQIPAYNSNIMSKTSPSIGTYASFNGALALFGNSRAQIDFGSNLPITLCTTHAETATVTITGFQQLATYNYSSAVSQSFSGATLPSNGCTTTDRNHWMNIITSVQVSGANFTGNLLIGAPDGPGAANCVTLSAPFFRIKDTLVQNCAGWGVYSNWNSGGSGFNSAYKTGQSYIDKLDIDLAEAGCFWINGPSDNYFSKIVTGFCNGVAAGWFDRNSSGSSVGASHWAGEVAGGSYGNMFPIYGLIDDAVTSEFVDNTFQDVLGSDILLRSDNATFNGGQISNQYSSVTFGQQNCIQIGDTNYNTPGVGQGMVADYRVWMRTTYCGGNGVFFAGTNIDGGGGSINTNGFDFDTTFSNSYSSGVTSVQFACGACTTQGFKTGDNVAVQLSPSPGGLNSGAGSVTLGSYNSGPNTWSISALPGNVSAGYVVWKSRGISGSYNTTAGSLSDMRVYYPGYTAFPSQFNQAAF